MITFGLMTVHDFMAIDEVKYDFESEAVRLLLGRNCDSTAADDNGAGKSSFAEALRWCLFGETTRQVIDKTLTVEHVMREGQQRVSVEVVFRNNTETYQVTRTRTATTQMLRVISTPNELPEDGSVNPTTTCKGKEAQELIIQALGINAVQFSNLVYLDGSYPLLFAPSSDRTRKDILADLVDVAAAEEAREIVAKKLVPINEEMQALEVQRARENAQIELILANKEALRLRGIEAKKDGEGAKAQLQLAKEALEVAQEKFADAFEDLHEAEKSDTRAEEEAALDFASKTATCDAAVAEKEKVITTYLVRELDEAKAGLDLLEQDYTLLTNQISKIEKLRAKGKCPTCSQDTATVMDGDLTDYQERLKAVANAIPGNRQTCEELESKRNQKVHTTTLNAKKRAEERDAAFAVLRNIREAARHKDLIAAKNTAERNLKVAEQHVTDIRTKITQARSRIAELRQQYEDCDTQIDQLDWHSGPERAEELATQRDNLLFWRDGFGPKGVPSLFIETVLPKISARIQRYANILTGGDLTVQLKAYRETKSNTIQESIQISAVNSKGASVYGSNSAGERNRINLAVTLGLIEYFRDMNVFESNLLICDEIFDGLDATGVQQALYALEEANMTHVIVVSHHESLKPLFPNVMYMTKENGSSTLEV
jgi:DNA repair exonuclease SbcCD ATPase subunit